MLRILSCCLLLACAPGLAWGGLYRVDFEGSILQGVGDTPFDVTIPSGATIMGHFLFDTASTGLEVTSPLANAGPAQSVIITRTLYRQTISGALSFTIPGALTGGSDSILITVGNDVRYTHLNSTLLDTFAVQYTQTANPQNPASVLPNAPFRINGSEPAAPYFSISLRAPDDDLYSSAALPLDFTLNHYNSRSISLYDNSPGGAQLRFSVDSLTITAVPEPTSAGLLIWGVIGIFVRKWRKMCLGD